MLSGCGLKKSTGGKFLRKFCFSKTDKRVNIYHIKFISFWYSQISFHFRMICHVCWPSDIIEWTYHNFEILEFWKPAVFNWRILVQTTRISWTQLRISWKWKSLKTTKYDIQMMDRITEKARMKNIRIWDFVCIY